MLKIIKNKDFTEVKFDNIKKLNVIVSAPIKSELQDLFETSEIKVLINMEGIEYIDSTGFSVLLSALRVSGRNNGQIVICSVSESAFELFKVLQLHTVFSIIKNREEAIKLFN